MASVSPGSTSTGSTASPGAGKLSLATPPIDAACRCNMAGTVRRAGGSTSHACSLIVGPSTEVGGLHPRVAGQRLRRAGQRDLAGLQHIAFVRAFERGARVLLDQQDRHA